MKKYLLPLLLLAAPAFAAQQEITAVPDSPVLPSIGALKDAVNLRLADIDENFDEIYPIIEAGPVYVNASAPADTKVVWIDTDQSNAIKVRIGEVWTVVGTAGEGSYTLPTAAADTLGGIKVGDRLTITDGVLSADVQTGDGTYPSAAGVANWDGSAWGTSYTVGTAANNLVQLNASAELPAVSGALLTSSFTGTLLGSETTLMGAIDTLGDELDAAVDITAGTGITIASGEISVTTGTYQAYDANMIVWPATVDATEVGYLNGLTEALSTTLTNKQNTLVSGTSIKTINSESLLGSGNIAISGSSAYTTAPTYSDETCTAGEYALDSGYVYFCRATNTWDRVALTAWSNPSPTTPTLTSATVGTLGLTADLLFSEAVDIGSGGNGGWSMSCATTGAISMTYSSGATTNTLAYSLSDTPIVNEVCTVSYTQPGNGVESDDDGADLATISSASVMNNSEVEGTSYADIIFYWDCDSTTANKSAGDTSASPQVSAAIDTALYQVGTGSCDSPSSYSRYDFTLNNDDLIDMDQGRVGMWVYVTENAGGRTIFRAAYDANNKVSLELFNTDLRVAMNYVAGGLGMQWEDTTPAAFELNTWFFLEFAWNKDAVGNDFQMWINGSSVLTADTESGTWSKGSSGTLSIGDFEGNGGDMHIDQVIISSDPTRDLYALRNNTSF